MIRLVVLPILMGSLAYAGAIESDERCDSVQTIAEEYMALELAGYRWQGGDSPCLSKLKLKTQVSVKSKGAADPLLLDPEFIIPDRRKVDIQAKCLPQDLIEVRVAYLGKKKKPGIKGGEDVAVKDRFTLKMNFGRDRIQKSCASILIPPVHLVMKKSCVAD